MRTIFDVKLDINFPTEIGFTTIQSSSLNACHLGHDFQLGIETRSAGWAKEVLVDLTAGTSSIVGAGRAYTQC